MLMLMLVLYNYIIDLCMFMSFMSLHSIVLLSFVDFMARQCTYNIMPHAKRHSHWSTAGTHSTCRGSWYHQSRTSLDSFLWLVGWLGEFQLVN